MAHRKQSTSGGDIVRFRIGHLEKSIERAFDVEPDSALTVEELASIAYGVDEAIDRKHKVAVRRALRSVLDRRRELSFLTSEGRGRKAVYYSSRSAKALELAKQKAAVVPLQDRNDESSSHFGPARYRDVPAGPRRMKAKAKVAGVLTPTDIIAWANRAETRVAEGLAISPGEPVRVLVVALRHYARMLRRQSAKAVASTRSGAR